MKWLIIFLTRWVTTMTSVTYPLMFSKCGQIRRLKVSFLSSFGWAQTHNNWCINYRSPKLDLITDRLEKFWQQNHILPNIKNHISAISKIMFGWVFFKTSLYLIYTMCNHLRLAFSSLFRNRKDIKNFIRLSNSMAYKKIKCD